MISAVLGSKKAQSITEIATFGSLLILVLSFLIRYGMIYIRQQEAQMEAFRAGLNLAYIGPYSGLNQGPNMFLVKDVSLPDPSDRFGLSNKVTVQGTADIVWTNQTQQGINPSDYVPGDPAASKTDGLPRISYVFNPQLAGGGQSKTYTTAGFTLLPVSIINATILGEEYEIPQSLTKVAVDPETKIKQVKALLLPPGQGTGYCNSNYCPTDILTSADVDSDDKDEIIIEAVGDENAIVGYTKNVDYQKGEIDREKMADDYDQAKTSDIVIAETAQGLLPASTHIVRGDSLTLTEDSKKITSISQLSGTETVTHTIRTKSGEEPIDAVFPRGGIKKWETQK
jgi:hypothetical protein